MGDEIKRCHFCRDDYQLYAEHMADEMALLHNWFTQHEFSEKPAVAGFELEAWIINQDFFPAPINDRFLKEADNPFLSAELAQFNIELNVTPYELHGSVFRRLHDDLRKLWQHCQETAAALDSRLIMTGILPTVRDEELNLKNMSALKRYRALNEQVMQARQGKPLHLEIVGEEHLSTIHRDVMLESAATSFQIHRQVPVSRAKRYYNAAIIASAPVVAVAANSPYLFGKQLWQESRIPLFEQAVEAGGYGDAARGPIRRVTFGSGYVKNSIEECFIENAEHYPILLPVNLGNELERMAHVRLHNGTIWRWNRPLIGFDQDGTPHVRIEHRVAAAGPSIVDEIANAVFFYGLQEYLANHDEEPESLLSFSQAKDNFYQSARNSIKAQVQWLDQPPQQLQRLLLDTLIPMAEKGLERLDVASSDIDAYLGIVNERVKSGQTGAAWQIKFAESNNRDMQLLTRVYLENQESGLPVHEWES